MTGSNLVLLHFKAFLNSTKQRQLHWILHINTETYMSHGEQNPFYRVTTEIRIMRYMAVCFGDFIAADRKVIETTGGKQYTGCLLCCLEDTSIPLYWTSAEPLTLSGSLVTTFLNWRQEKSRKTWCHMTHAQHVNISLSSSEAPGCFCQCMTGILKK